MNNGKVLKSIVYVATAVGMFFMMIGVAFFMASCNDENRLTLKDSQDIAEDALTDSYFADADDMSGIAMQSDNETAGQAPATGARSINIQDSRMNCATVTITPDATSTQAVPKGVITLDFGSGCTDLRGNVREGKIIITYNGRRFIPGSTVILTTDGYSINGIALEGTRTLTNISGSTEAAPKFSIVLTGGKATFPDGSVALREASFTREWIRAANPTEDQLRVEGSASGTTRRERSYTMTIEETLVYKRFCELPVSGVKIFTVDGKPITIDYGDGECDRSVTYTVGDNTVTTNVGKN
jgi:hypothetical protein